MNIIQADVVEMGNAPSGKTTTVFVPYFNQDMREQDVEKAFQSHRTAVQIHCIAGTVAYTDRVVQVSIERPAHRSFIARAN